MQPAQLTLVGSDDSILGNLLRYVRYVAAGTAGIRTSAAYRGRKGRGVTSELLS